MPSGPLVVSGAATFLATESVESGVVELSVSVAESSTAATGPATGSLQIDYCRTALVADQSHRVCCTPTRHTVGWEWEAWQEKGSHQQRYGPYTHIQPTPKKVKPQQECQRFKVQALSQLDVIANEGLQAVEAELTTMAWTRNQQIWLRLDQPHGSRMHCENSDNHGEPLQMSNQELYSVMVHISWTLKTQALANMQVQWRPKSAGKWQPFQWEAVLHCPTAEGHRAVPSSVSRTGDCMHLWLTRRAGLLRLFQRTLFRQADPVPGDAVRFLYTLLNTPPCERRYA